MVGRFLYYWLPIPAYAVLIFYLSTLPASSVHLPPISHIDKAAHVCEYGAFGMLLARAFAAGGAGLSTRQAVLGAWIVATLYGASDEFHQFFVPTRSCEWGDWIADSTGGLVGALTFFWAVHRIGQRWRRAPGEAT
jgi:VanZ family protein